MSMLERLSSPDTVQPTANHLVGALYRLLLGEVADRVLATSLVSSPTRMAEFTDAGVYAGEAIDRNQRVVVVDVARAESSPRTASTRGSTP